MLLNSYGCANEFFFTQYIQPFTHTYTCMAIHLYEYVYSRHWAMKTCESHFLKCFNWEEGRSVRLGNSPSHRI